MEPKRKNIGAMVGRLSPHLFGRHVSDGPHHHAWVGRHLHRRRIAGVGVLLGTGKLGQAEVQNLYTIVVGDEQVLRLEVAMNDTLVVRRG